MRVAFSHSLWQDHFLLIVEKLFGAIHLSCDLLGVILSSIYLALEKHIGDSRIVSIERFGSSESYMMAVSF